MFPTINHFCNPLCFGKDTDYTFLIWNGSNCDLPAFSQYSTIVLIQLNSKLDTGDRYERSTPNTQIEIVFYTSSYHSIPFKEVCPIVRFLGLDGSTQGKMTSKQKLTNSLISSWWEGIHKMLWSRHLHRFMRKTEMNYSPNVNQKSRKTFSCVMCIECYLLGIWAWHMQCCGNTEIKGHLPLFSFFWSQDILAHCRHTQKLPRVSFLAKIVLHVLTAKRSTLLPALWPTLRNK